jgi:hypothetical protein
LVVAVSALGLSRPLLIFSEQRLPS